MAIHRNLSDAESRQYELTVVGGGVYGISVAIEAARRGLEVLMIERDDFGSGVSWNSLRILHGGLRYLQSMDLVRYVESVGERRWFLKHFPDVCGPMACMMPLYGKGMRRAAIMRIALLMNDILSIKRNHGVPPKNELGRGVIISSRRAGEQFPLVERKGLEAAAIWYDGQIQNSPRLTMEMCQWASSLGAVLLNHVEATGLDSESGKVSGVRAVDRVSGQELRFRTGAIINAAGPWCEVVAERMGEVETELFPPAFAFNVLFSRPPMAETAVAVTAEELGARTYFLHNEGSYLLGGTYHVALKDSGSNADRGVQLKEFVKDYILQVNRAVPGLNLHENQVLRVYGGRLPAKKAGREEPTDRPKILDHGSHGGIKGLWSVSGVKYTTARLVAEKTINAAFPGKIRQAREISRMPSSDRALIAMSGEIEKLPLEEVIACAKSLKHGESVTCFADLMLGRTAWALDPDVGKRIATKIGPELGYTFDEIEACRSAIGNRPFQEEYAIQQSAV
jgi:glycerol-3-phosphate dehydrogenase